MYKNSRWSSVHVGYSFFKIYFLSNLSLIEHFMEFVTVIKFNNTFHQRLLKFIKNMIFIKIKQGFNFFDLIIHK